MQIVFKIRENLINKTLIYLNVFLCILSLLFGHTSWLTILYMITALDMLLYYRSQIIVNDTQIKLNFASIENLIFGSFKSFRNKSILIKNLKQILIVEGDFDKLVLMDKNNNQIEISSRMLTPFQLTELLSEIKNKNSNVVIDSGLKILKSKFFENTFLKQFASKELILYSFNFLATIYLLLNSVSGFF